MAPFLLSAVYKKYGQSPLEHPAKRDYVNNLDAPRTARFKGLELKRPEGWPQHALPPCRVFYWIESSDPALARAYAKRHIGPTGWRAGVPPRPK